MFRKIGVLKNLKIFRGKPVCQSLFFNKVAAWKETLAFVSSCEYCKISKNIFFIEHLRWLPLLKLEPILLNQQNFSCSYFLLHLISWTSSTLLQNNLKTRYAQKNICSGVQSFAIQTSKHLNYNKTVCSYMYTTIEVSCISWVSVALKFFPNDLSVKTRLYS